MPNYEQTDLKTAIVGGLKIDAHWSTIRFFDEKRRQKCEISLEIGKKLVK